ncbi:MAG: glycoside hydrolase family 3 C-terminal domain-containing protein [Bacillus sp. (in: Bacteria)]|nr:glycoside hydrolase family 3 C-terminal domain-containing protein [Bacillus sp. (in: firmicutes)]
MDMVNDVLRQMTLEEKASLCSGKDFWHLKAINRLNIPSVMLADGPHGLRKQSEGADHLGIHDIVPSTCFPTAVTLASSWDLELLQEVGKALGEECLQEGVSVLLGPGINLKRSPLCGRNFEYFSEDPYITGEMAAAFIKGVQSQGVGTSLKHFAANNQESNRMTIDTFVDERAFRELYLPGFETAVKKAQPWTVMCSYNKVNGIYASENKRLLTTVLKDEWGYEGIVVSDWGATNDRVLGLQAGLDLEMPSSFGENDRLIVEAVQNGNLAVEVLDEAVKRLLTLILKAEKSHRQNTYDKQKHHQLARKAAAESTVLLKNEAAMLPLALEEKLAVIGEMAKVPRYQGAGSSLVNPTKLVSAYAALEERIGKDGFVYADGYEVNRETTDRERLEEAVKVAKKADKVIVFVGLTELFESEGFDREHLYIPQSHADLIEAIGDVNENLIVVLENGAPVVMPWVGKTKAVVETYLGGQAGGEALWDVLFGDVNPSGKLAETFPVMLEDTPCANYFPMGPTAVEYRESIYVGYRYYDTAEKPVLFPFGHGLSFTKFEYSDLIMNRAKLKDTELLEVTVSVKNIGDRFGKEVVQLYVADSESTIFRPKKELRSFAKVALEPGEVKQVSFTLDKRAFAYYNVELSDWVVESGEFEILVGASSHDIRLTEKMWVESTTGFDEGKNDRRDEWNVYYGVTSDWSVDKASFEKLYGEEIVYEKLSQKGSFHRNSRVIDMKSTWLGNLLYKVMVRELEKKEIKDEKTKAMYVAALNELPLRGLQMGSEGKLTMDMIDGLVHMLNGKWWRVVKQLIKKE